MEVTEDLTQIELTYLQSVYLKNKDYTFYSALHKTFSKTGQHVLGHKVSLSRNIGKLK